MNGKIAEHMYPHFSIRALSEEPILAVSLAYLDQVWRYLPRNEVSENVGGMSSLLKDIAHGVRLLKHRRCLYVLPQIDSKIASRSLNLQVCTWKGSEFKNILTSSYTRWKQMGLKLGQQRRARLPYNLRKTSIYTFLPS